MKKKGLKIASLFLVIVLMVSLLTGCGFAGPQYNKDTKFDNGNDGHLENGNKLCVIWKSHITGFDPAKGSNSSSISNQKDHTKYGKGGLVLWSVKLDANADYGLNAKEEGFTFFITVAVMMYESVFNSGRTTETNPDEEWQNSGSGVEVTNPYSDWYRMDVAQRYGSVDYFYNYANKLDKLSFAPKHVLKTTLESTADLLSLDAVKDDGSIDQNAGIQDSLQTVIGTIKSLAMAILVAMWCIEFISQIIAERFTMETMLKTFMQLLCGVVIIENATFLVACFAQLGNTLSASMVSGTGDAVFKGFKETVLDIFIKKSITAFNIALDMEFLSFGIGTIWFDGGCLWAILILAFPLYTQLQCSFKIVSRMIMRMLELTARITFAPIPLAFSAQRGFDTGTIKYLREILACALEPALIVVGVACIDSVYEMIGKILGFNVDVAGFTVGAIPGAIMVSMSYLVLSAYIASAKSLSQEIIAR